MSTPTVLLNYDVTQGDIILSILIVICISFVLRMMNKLMLCSIPFHYTINTIDECFPNAFTNNEFIHYIQNKLSKFDATFDPKTTLLATSICSDEINRPLEKDLSSIYGHYFSMGGLAGCK